MNLIPKIIHQIWSDKYKPLPKAFIVLSETWKEKHADWQYMHWDEEKMESFVKKEYPQYYSFYTSLPFDMQRWDAIRFLILYKMGGMHVDFDYECWENLEPLFLKDCNIALEPESNCIKYQKKYLLNSALLSCVPNHTFISNVIDKIFSSQTLEFDRTHKPLCILNTTGPLMLSNLYESLPEAEKENVHLLLAKYVTPFNSSQIRLIRSGVENEELEACLDEAYAIHYFSNAWIPELFTHQ